jgi:hypothetical protein
MSAERGRLPPGRAAARTSLADGYAFIDGRCWPEPATVDAAGQRPWIGQPETTRQFGRAQPAGQLQQGERVASCLGDDPVAHLRIHPSADRRGQQRARVGIAEAGDGQPGQAGQLLVVAGLARGEDQGDRLGLPAVVAADPAAGAG